MSDNSPNNQVMEQEKNRSNQDKKKLYFVTNDNNLKEILISGVIKHKEGYKKYYSDFCELAPNCLPIFVDEIPKNLLSHCKKTDDETIVAIEFNFNFKDIKDYIVAYIENKTEEPKTALDNNKDVSVVYLNKTRDGNSIEEETIENKVVTPEPKFDFNKGLYVVYLNKIISISNIKEVFFENKKLKDKFTEDRGTINNFNINLLKYKVPTKKSKLFEKNNGYLKDVETLRLSQSKNDNKNKNLIINSKIGCLSYLINNLPSINDSKKLLSIINEKKAEFDNKLCILPKELSTLMFWIKDEASKKANDANAEIFILILNFLANLEPVNGLSSESLEDLKNKIEGYKEKKAWHEKLLERLRQMKKIISNEGASSENFFLDAKMKSSPLKGLLLFLKYHEKVNDENLSNENIKKWKITKNDIIFRKIFYSTWKGWNLLENSIGVSNKKKDQEDLFKKLSDYYEYLFNGVLINEKDSFDFKPFGNMKNLTKDILLKEKWDDKIKSFAIEYANHHALECLSHEIKASSKNDLNLIFLPINKKSLCIKLQGKVDIITEINEEAFKESLKEIEFSEREKENFNIIYNS